MYVFLSKFLPLLIYPVGMTFLLLLASFLLGKRPKLRNLLLVVAALLIFLSGNRLVSMSLARSLEWRYLPPADFPSIEVAVVLGGATEPDQYPRSGVEVNSAGDRVLYAAKLYQEGKVKNLLLSGGTISWYEGDTSTPAQEMKEILMLTGVPETALWLEDQSQNTEENALFSARILKEKGVSQVLLITSAMHMPRSVQMFESQGVQVIPAPTDYTVTRTGWENLWRGSIQEGILNLLPTSGNIALTTNVLKEYIGMGMYSTRDWLK